MKFNECQLIYDFSTIIDCNATYTKVENRMQREKYNIKHENETYVAVCSLPDAWA